MGIEDSKKTIVEKIIDLTLEKLELSGKYPEPILVRLEEIAKAGSLNQKEPIIQSLEGKMEGVNETS